MFWVEKCPALPPAAALEALLFFLGGGVLATQGLEAKGGAFFPIFLQPL